MLLKILFFSLLLPFYFSEKLPSHALHLSTFEMTINSDKAFAAVRLRVFQDDLRDAIKNANPDLSPVANERFIVERQVEIEQYFQQHLQLVFAEQNTLAHFKHGHEEADIYWLELNLVFSEKWEQCSLKADYLLELFDDQSNIGTVILEEKKEFFRFTQRETIFPIAYP